ncbi:MAG: riboflavin biosynthesis protein RibF [Lentisphaerae bacterium]|nr:riboflavin biosynthesis protein RibF [Lentisphaerota bacterium]
MKILTDLSLLVGEPGKIVLAAGFFDSVHIGHKRVIERTIAAARKCKASPWILTFDTHPMRILRPAIAPLLLTSDKHKLLLFQRTGVEGCIVLRFDKYLAQMTPSDFVKHLTNSGKISKIFVGTNWRFGKNRRGNPVLLSKLGRRYGFDVTAVMPVMRDGTPVSSTRIRKNIAQGNLVKAAQLLGRPVSVLGTVVRGRAIGQTLGFPTANLSLYNEVVPPLGVYAIHALLDGKLYDGVLNLGIRPTFSKKLSPKPIMELHLFGVSRKIYGKDIEVFFVEKIRNERKFDSRAELAQHIACDIAKATIILRKKSSKNRFTRIPISYYSAALDKKERKRKRDNRKSVGQ